VAVTSRGRHAGSASMGGTLKIWEVSKGVEKGTLESHTSSVTGGALTSAGRHLVSAAYYPTLKIWDLSNRQTVVTVETNARLECCAVTPDGKIIVAGDSLGAVHILDWIHP